MNGGQSREPCHEINGILGPKSMMARANGGSQDMKSGDSPVTLLQVSSKDYSWNAQMVTVGLYLNLLTELSPVSIGPQTVQLEGAQLTPANSNHLLRAKIEWASGKARNVARLDFVHGQRVSLPATYVQVTAIYDHWLAGAPYDAPGGPQVRVSADVTYGAVSSNICQFTDDPIAVPASTPTTYRQIPDFARELVVSGDNNTSNWLVSFSSENKVNPRSTNIVVPTNTAVSIPNGMEFYSVTNQDAGAGHLMWPIFKLFL